MEGWREKFHWADYLVFACSLGIGVVVGITLAIKERWLKQSAESYLMADRQMNWVLVGLSFWATVVPASFFIGLLTEFYMYGMTMLWVILARYIGAVFTVLVVIPKFYRMGFTITSAYEYFERRFNLPVRIAVGCLFVFAQMLIMAVSLYAPSLILARVSDISLHWSIFLGGIVCFIYTAFGGMKAVIWVDSIQVLIMTLGMCVLAGYGVVSAGGLSVAWERYTQLGERDNWNDVDPSPWNRHSVWNVLLLHGVTFAGKFSASQSVLQRYMTVPRMKRSQLSVLLGVTIGIPFTLIMFLAAMAAFASIGANDPLLNGKLHKPDQLMAYFLMYLLGDYHGLPGLVIASLFAAGLSTMSSGQNALAAVLTKDFAAPIYNRRTQRELKDKFVGFISRIAGIVVGAATIGLALVMPYFKDTLISLSLSVGSLLTGPIMGLLITGFFCFWVEAWGALVGFLCSLAWAIMLYSGAQIHGSGIGKERAPLFNNNFTEIVYFSESGLSPSLFDTSYTWYVTLNLVVVIMVSSVISLIIHCVRQSGRLKRSAMFTDKDLQYTFADLKAALGCTKTEKNVCDIVPYDMPEIGHTERNGGTNDTVKRATGIDNIAYQSDRL